MDVSAVAAPAARRSAARLYAGVGAAFLIVVIALFGGIVWFNFKKTTELSLLAADRLVTEMSDKIIERIQRLYDPMIAVVGISAQMPDVGELMTLEPRGLQFWLRGLAIYPQIFSVYAGDGNGGFFMLTRARSAASAEVERQLGSPPQAIYAVEQIAPAASGKPQAVWTFLDRDGAILERRDGAPTDFDPRERPWYRAALADDRVHRTDPYIFAASKELGVTLSRQLVTATGVFGADIIVSELAAFLAEQKVTPLSEVMLLNRKGEPIAPGAGMSSKPILAAVAEHIAGGKMPGAMRLEIAGTEYLVQVKPVPDRYGSDEFLATVVPVDEILAPLRTIQKRILAYSIGLLVIALPLYVTMILMLIDRGLGRKKVRYAVDEEDE